MTTTGTSKEIRELLDNLLEPVDSIHEHSEDPHAVETLRARIQTGLEPFLAAAANANAIQDRLAELKGLKDPEEHRTNDHRLMTEMLSELEKMAFALGQHQWAESHGFRNPEHPDRS